MRDSEWSLLCATEKLPETQGCWLYLQAPVETTLASEYLSDRRQAFSLISPSGCSPPTASLVSDFVLFFNFLLNANALVGGGDEAFIESYRTLFIISFGKVLISLTLRNIFIS